MAERGGQTPRDGTEHTGLGMATAATGLLVDATAAGADGGAQIAGAQNPQPPLEGGGLGHVDGVARQVQGGQTQFKPEEIARIVRENLELRIRMEVEAEQGATIERYEQQLIKKWHEHLEQHRQDEQHNREKIVQQEQRQGKITQAAVDNLIAKSREFTSIRATYLCLLYTSDAADE